MAGLEIENSQGVVALDQQQWRDLRNGYGVAPSTALGTLNGECEVTINGTGDLGTGNSALSVGSGTVLFGGTTTSVSAQNVDIDAGQSNPRKDVVYIDTNGDAQVNKGSPASVPSDAPGDRFQTWKPAPYDMHDVDAVVLAEVWVPANASSIGSADVRDRRLRADLETRAFATDDLDIGTSDFVATGDDYGAATFGGLDDEEAVSSSSYTQVLHIFEYQWDQFVPAGTTVRWSLVGLVDDGGNSIDVRLHNRIDDETVLEGTDVGDNAGNPIGITLSGTYTPTTTNGRAEVALQIRNGDDATTVQIKQVGVTIAPEV